MIAERNLPSSSTIPPRNLMPDYIVCTRAIKGGSFSSEPGPTRYLKIPDKRNPDPFHEINRTAFIVIVKMSCAIHLPYP